MVNNARSVPMRTCIGCRAVEPSVHLIRVVVESSSLRSSQNGVVGPVAARVDRFGGLPGRGCWIHPQQSCLDMAGKRRAFSRALRTQGEINLSDVQAYVTQLAQAN